MLNIFLANGKYREIYKITRFGTFPEYFTCKYYKTKRVHCLVHWQRTKSFFPCHFVLYAALSSITTETKGKVIKKKFRKKQFMESNAVPSCANIFPSIEKKNETHCNFSSIYMASIHIDHILYRNCVAVGFAFIFNSLGLFNQTIVRQKKKNCLALSFRQKPTAYHELRHVRYFLFSISK